MTNCVFFPFSAKYIGCYIDDTQKRALRGVSFFDYKKMTVFRCQDNCAERYDSSKQQKKNHPLGKLTFFFLLSFDSYWEIKKKPSTTKELKGR